VSQNAPLFSIIYPLCRTISKKKNGLRLFLLPLHHPFSNMFSHLHIRKSTNEMGKKRGEKKRKSEASYLPRPYCSPTPWPVFLFLLTLTPLPHLCLSSTHRNLASATILHQDGFLLISSMVYHQVAKSNKHSAVKK
jgi:hypothetical protein